MSDRCNRLDAQRKKFIRKIEIEDIDGNVEISGDAAENAFKKLFGMEETKDKLRLIGKRMKMMQGEGRDTKSLVKNYVFTGAPGTGKTTLAQSIGSIFHSYGLLATDHVEITSALDLTGQYTGQTKEKVAKIMSAARGGVLFIDEAYVLGGPKGSYGEEAMTKLLSMLTEDDYKGKMIVVLAGYENQIHQMLQVNPGLKSRFEEIIHFEDWAGKKCCEFIIQSICEKLIPVPYEINPSEKEEIEKRLTAYMTELQKRSGWANVRDADAMINKIQKHRDNRILNQLDKNENFREDPPKLKLEDILYAGEEFIKYRPYSLETTNALPDQSHASENTSNTEVKVSFGMKKDVSPLEVKVEESKLEEDIEMQELEEAARRVIEAEESKLQKDKKDDLLKRLNEEKEKLRKRRELELQLKRELEEKEIKVKAAKDDKERERLLEEQRRIKGYKQIIIKFSVFIN